MEDAIQDPEMEYLALEGKLFPLKAGLCPLWDKVDESQDRMFSLSCLDTLVSFIGLIRLLVLFWTLAQEMDG